ncbi:hypothetical protein [Pseudonocardia sp. KRD291]|uniref:hypothetical protein n=1 Tax=Pseudonocardia sp. KRD291 TaxID=2792007 RepID=UPI001C4A45B7|nr:hypothetical protein [Pseudonocardia sp. KRD291]MBW0103734.1 hypothetical protein [Pseudonocardia sp. KRD291]
MRALFTRSTVALMALVALLALAGLGSAQDCGAPTTAAPVVDLTASMPSMHSMPSVASADTVPGCPDCVAGAPAPDTATSRILASGESLPGVSPGECTLDHPCHRAPPRDHDSSGAAAVRASAETTAAVALRAYALADRPAAPVPPVSVAGPVPPSAVSSPVAVLCVDRN